MECAKIEICGVVYLQCNQPGVFANFKDTLLFDAEYFRNGTKYRHSFNGILIVAEHNQMR